MIPKIIDYQPMQRMSVCRVRFSHCGRTFLSCAIYKITSAKRVVISWFVFQSLRHFRSVSSDAVHLLRIPL